MKPALTDHLEWKGRPYTAELYRSNDQAGVSPIVQVQAVCFTNNGHVVFQRHVKGWLGLPGGHPEEGEDLKSALQRELFEEISAELVDFGIVGYEKTWYDDDPARVEYFLRCWAQVTLLDQPVSDPDGKSLGREVVELGKAAKMLGWGDRGERILEWAHAAIKAKRS